MYYTIYKGNSKNSGGAGSFRVSTDGERPVLFVEFIKQLSWDDANQKPTFDTDSRKTIVLSATEAGDIIYSILNKVPWKGFHSTKEGVKTNIVFSPWERKGQIAQWSGSKTCWGLRVTTGDESHALPLTSGETEVVRVMLEQYIKDVLEANQKISEKWKERK